MGLNWNEIKSRGMLFSKANTFWIAFFEIFGITDKRVATFELNVNQLSGEAAHCVLNSLAQFASSLLVNLYASLTMTPSPLKAQQKLDAAFDAERVTSLYELYQ